MPDGAAPRYPPRCAIDAGRDGAFPHLVRVHSVVRSNTILWTYSGSGLSGTEINGQSYDVAILELEFVAFRPELCHAAWQQTRAHYMSVEFDPEIRRDALSGLCEN